MQVLQEKSKTTTRRKGTTRQTMVCQRQRLKEKEQQDKQWSVKDND